MTIYIIIGILTSTIAILGIGVVIVGLKEDGKRAFKTPAFYGIIAGVIIFFIAAFFSLRQYKREVISYAMANYELGNYTRSEYYIDGQCVDVTFSIGDLDLD